MELGPHDHREDAPRFIIYSEVIYNLLVLYFFSTLLVERFKEDLYKATMTDLY